MPSSAATSPSWWLWRRKSLQIHASSTSDTLPTANVAATDSRALVQEDLAAGEGEAHPRPSQDTPLFGYDDEKVSLSSCFCATEKPHSSVVSATTVVRVLCSCSAGET